MDEVEQEEGGGVQGCWEGDQPEEGDFGRGGVARLEVEESEEEGLGWAGGRVGEKMGEGETRES